MFLVRGGAIEGFSSLVTTLGANPVALMADVGMVPSQLRDPNVYVSYSKMAALLERAARQCGEPLFGLLLASRQTSAVLGDLTLALAQRPSLGEALESANNHLYLHARGAYLVQEAVGDDIRVELRIEIGSGSSLLQLMQMSTGHLANFIYELLGLPRVTFPLLLRQAPPFEGAGAVGRHIFSRLTFDSPVNGVQIPRSWLERRPHLDEETLRRHFQSHLLQLQQRYPENFPDQVRDVIGRMLPTGDCRVELVAKTLDLHPRVLQKRLKRLGNSYNQLLRETRMDIARQHLRHKSMAITDLALNLGYSDISVFSRNFKQWTGLSPRQWQNANAC